MPAIESFLTLEDTLKTRLINKWEKIVSPLVKRMRLQIMEGQVGGASDQIEELNLKRIVAGEQRFIEFHSIGSYLYGASNFTGDVATTEAIRQGSKPEIIGPAVDTFKAMIEDIDQTLRVQAAETIQRADAIVRAWKDERQKRPVTKVALAELPQPFDIKDFEEYFGPEIIVAEITLTEMREFLEVFMQKRISATGGSVITAAASTHTSRLSSYGFLIEAQLFGVTKYKVSEQLDGRTCPVCRRMHGKVFDVDDAFGRLDGILRIDDPRALKQAAPWPSQSKAGLAELDGLSLGGLQSRGFGFPPYHPNCRGVLLPVDGNAPPLY